MTIQFERSKPLVILRLRNAPAMPDLNVQSNPAVAEVFANYPGFVKPQMNRLRQLILETAGDIKELSAIEETLKWGEPSYLAKKGSTIRID